MRPLQSTSIRIPTPSCTNTACSCEGIDVGDAAQWYGNVAALVFTRPPHAAAWVFSGTEAPAKKNPTVSIHDACVANVSLGVDRAQQLM